MKKFTVLVALALLAATGTSYAVTCSYDNVPGATLLVPYFKVSRNGVTSNATDIPEGGVDTIVAITNVSYWGVNAHVTVWNKQSAPVLDFNVPMSGYDVVFFRMKDILNGKLNVNANSLQQLIGGLDPCTVLVGNDQELFVRFRNPDTLFPAEYSVYNVPAFAFGFRDKVWHSLDEGFDYSDIVTRPAADKYNPACGTGTATTLSGDFTGYLTIDVTNYCTQLFPSDPNFYINDAIATQGWDLNAGPNVLMGDVFFIDGAEGGNISGDVAIALEYDNRLDWTTDKTFYARYTQASVTSAGTITDSTTTSAAPAAYRFIGDGREPLGNYYGFRYLNDAAAGMKSWITVWRSDLWDTVIDVAQTPYRSSLCSTAYMSQPIVYTTWDNDENPISTPTSPDPSGGDTVTTNPYIWYETQRIAITGSQLTKTDFKGGWTRVSFPYEVSARFNQAYVGVMHTAPGAFVSVGHPATLLNNDFTCPGNIVTTPGIGNIDFGPVTP